MTYYLLYRGQPSAKRLLKRVANLRPFTTASELRSDDVVIRWGATDTPDPVNTQVLNPSAAVARTRSRSEMAQFLRRVGVRVVSKGSNQPTFLRHYRFPIFDLQALTCFRADQGAAWLNQRIQRVPEHFREVPLDDDKVTTRAMYYALRALHALGLDHGLVSVSMAPQGVLYVVDVTPAPVLSGRLLDLYANAVEASIDRDAESPSPFLLGTDVELMLRNSAGKMVLASRYFTRKGAIGCDDRSIQFDGKRLPLLELRPAPAAQPMTVVSNLRALMVEASETINREGVEWRAGSMPFRPFSIGGHIHFSGIPFSSRLVRVLDNYLGLPLMVVEDPRTAVLRRKRYGFYGDVRHKDHGGFEYRTPASFVVSPEVTAAALALAYVIGHHHRELPIPTDLYEASLQRAFFQGQAEVLAPLAEHNLTLLSRFSAYQRVREQIEPLIAMIQSRTVWNEDIDVRVAWGIPLSKKKPTKRGRRRAPTMLRA
ncbi:MAG: hypothetical protein K6T78_07225 [Alicyclobacillus sp.]|nr:hypothetical protein [Alicyclobacillus sp.]